MKKLVILPAIALLTILGVFTLGQQSKPVHATGPTTVQAESLNQQNQSTVSGGKLDGTETGTEVKGKEASEKGSESKGIEADGPGGHQDPQGTNVDHQFNGTE